MSVGALIATDARADSTDCTTLLGTPGKILILGNIVVPKDATCIIFNATVNGNIDQQSDSQLILRGNVTVNGNISSHGGAIIATEPGATPPINKIAGNVEIDSTSQVGLCVPFRIDGNLAISNASTSVDLAPGLCKGASDTDIGSIGGNVSITNNNVINLSIIFNTIGKNLSVTNNEVSSHLAVGLNTIGKNMSVTNNSGSGKKVVTLNTVTGNLECSGNQSTSTNPFIGSPNTVMGKVTGQCGK
jgi:hypothetical protein